MILVAFQASVSFQRWSSRLQLHFLLWQFFLHWQLSYPSLFAHLLPSRLVQWLAHQLGDQEVSCFTLGRGLKCSSLVKLKSRSLCLKWMVFDWNQSQMVKNQSEIAQMVERACLTERTRVQVPPLLCCSIIWGWVTTKKYRRPNMLYIKVLGSQICW